MATSTHTLSHRRYSLPTLWHLLSLDAPTVAALWFALAARAAHLSIHFEDAVALAVGTWILYVVDRMLDAHHSAAHLQEERHRFHGSNWLFFAGALVCAIPTLLLLLMRMEPELLHAYLLLGLAMAGYFALIHTPFFARRIPKELAVGAVFALAIFMPELLTEGLHLLLPALCFGALCWLNCALIYQREHTTFGGAHWSTRLAVRHMPWLFAALIAASAVLFLAGEMFSALYLSIALSALLLAMLQRVQHRIGRLPFRVAVDTALLTPILFLLR